MLADLERICELLSPISEDRARHAVNLACNIALNMSTNQMKFGAMLGSLIATLHDSGMSKEDVGELLVKFSASILETGKAERPKRSN